MATYINGISIKETKFGMKVSIKKEAFEAELATHVNEKGYVNLEIIKRKEEGKYGDTHFAKLNEWKNDKSDNLL